MCPAPMHVATIWYRSMYSYVRCAPYMNCYSFNISACPPPAPFHTVKRNAGKFEYFIISLSRFLHILCMQFAIHRGRGGEGELFSVQAGGGSCTLHKFQPWISFNIQKMKGRPVSVVHLPFRFLFCKVCQLSSRTNSLDNKLYFLWKKRFVQSS
jgi:hypothetical protein